MASRPEPGDDVPDFLVENFETEPVTKLRAISVFAETEDRRSAVPQYVRNAFAVQDDTVKQAVGEYAGDLAEFLEAEGHKTLADAPEPEEEGPPGETMGSAFYNPGRNPGNDDDDDDDDDGLLGGLLGD
jgi:hypothetical protein